MFFVFPSCFMSGDVGRSTFVKSHTARRDQFFLSSSLGFFFLAEFKRIVSIT
jgi:hypothetical protein